MKKLKMLRRITRLLCFCGWAGCLVLAMMSDSNSIGFFAPFVDEKEPRLIAVEAGETIIVDQEAVIKYADKHNIVIMAV